MVLNGGDEVRRQPGRMPGMKVQIYEMVSNKQKVRCTPPVDMILILPMIDS